MLFNFRLRPLDQVTPWGAPENPTLHWFGLTDGEYWIDAGSAVLFEFSEEAQNHLGCSRYCDYQVVRLHEDLLEKAQYLLEPVPDDLQPPLLQFLRRDAGRSATLKRRLDAYYASDGPDDPRLDEAVACVCEFIGRRQIDTAYLVNGPRLAFWSNASLTYIVWDTENRPDDEFKRRWSAPSGETSMPRRVFLEELKNFHDRLMTEMESRIAAVVQGALSPEIKVDTRAMLHDHETRRHEIETAFRPPSAPTDWAAVRAAIDEMNKIPI